MDEISEAVKLIQQGFAKLAGGPLDYHLTKLARARELLLTRFAPFKVGDRVTLARDLSIERTSGWYHCRHFLVPGEPATVRESDCDSDGNLRFSIEFDNETWVDEEGNRRPTSLRHIFMFFEKDLVPVDGAVIREAQNDS